MTRTKRDANQKKTIPEKCRKCAMLSSQQAQSLHGAEGDGCWNPMVCHSRRSYIRNRDRINQTRSRRRKEREGQPELEQLVVDYVPLAQITYAVLQVYRPMGADTPVHAIGAEVYQGQEKIAMVPVVHCLGLLPSQVHGYVRSMVNALEDRYGIHKFASQVRMEVALCPVRPCPHHPQG
jgi:hypothetical protein